MLITRLRPRATGRWTGLAVLLGAFVAAGCGEKPVQHLPTEEVEIFLKENPKGLLAPATAEGKLWPECEPAQCRPLLEEKPEIPNAAEFPLVLVEKIAKSNKKGEREQSAAKVSAGGLVSVAEANSGSDNNCTVIWVHYPLIGWIPYYNPNDPDCPP